MSRPPAVGLGLPRARPGQRIGLFGGSFDPAHAGHAHVAEQALRRLGLDAVWWLVTPQNPLKARSSPLADRAASAAALAPSARHRPTLVETRLGLRYSADTLEALQRRYPGVRFVWIMGADAAAGFHRWRRWRAILRAAPVLIVARPGFSAAITRAKPWAAIAGARRPADRALPGRAAPAFAYLPVRLHTASSTAIRANGAPAPG